MLNESGLSDAIKNPEAVRTKLLEIQNKIKELRSQVEDENGKYTKKDLVKIRKQLEDANKEAIDVLNENIDIKKLEEIMGKSNANAFMNGGAQAINIISKGIRVPENDTNLCYIAANLFLSENNINQGVNITINKNIPIGGGLGGGSSNASSVIKGLCKLFNIHYDIK